jgi:hypothetical protein
MNTIYAKTMEAGRVMATPNAIENVPELDMMLALQRHVHGDWGELGNEDRKANDDALLCGGRLLSSYRTVPKKIKFWIITEADRSVTTILLPEDY